LAAVEMIMKSSSRINGAEQAFIGWQPVEFATEAPEDAVVTPDEIMALFKGNLPMRPPAALRGSSGLLPRQASQASQPWQVAELPKTVRQPEYERISEAKATPRPLSGTGQRKSDAALVEATREKVNHLFEEAHNTRAEAMRILTDAQLQAQEILEKARQEAERRVREAYDLGKAQAEAEFTSSTRTAQAILSEVATWRDEMLSQSESAVIEMVKDMARTLFSNGMLVDHTVLQDTFTKALLRGRSLGNLRIFVHPEDAARLDPGWRDFQVTISGQRIQIVPTESVRPGGCYIEGDQGTVDARIETRLDAVLNVFENQTG
jgi:flagellar assembly protein FliH